VRNRVNLLKSLLTVAAVMFAGAGMLTAQTLSTEPNILSFSVPAGSDPVSKILVVSSTTGDLDFTVTVATNPVSTWLSAVPLTGKTQTSRFVFVTVTAAGLTAGGYSGTITITAAGATNSPLSVPVTLSVGGGGSTSTLTAFPTALAFSYVTGGATPTPQNLSISTTTGLSTYFTALPSTTSGGYWLTINPAAGTTPTIIQVAVNPTGMGAGTYYGTITLTPTGGGALQVPVTFTISGTPQLSANPSSLTFYYQVGGTSPPQQSFSLTSGGFPLYFTAAFTPVTGGNWLVVTPVVGMTATDITAYINSVVLATLTPGTYTGNITFTAPGASNSPFNVGVTLWVSVNPFLTVSPNRLAFGIQPGGVTPANQTLSVSSTGTSIVYTVATSTTTGFNWLTAIPSSATTPGQVSVGLNAMASTLPVGTYSGTVTLTPTTAGTPQVTVQVTLTVSGTPALNITPGTMYFVFQTTKTAPAAQTVTVTSSGVPTSFTATVNAGTGGNWLSITPTTGSTPATLSVSVNITGLAVGTYQASITFTPVGTASAVQVLQVYLTVSDAALLTVSPGYLAFSFPLGTASTGLQYISLTSTGDPLNFAVTPTTTPAGATWLFVAPLTGTTPSSLTVFVNPTGLPVGTYSGSIAVAAQGANSQAMPVTVTITSTAALAITPTSLSFTQTYGGVAPAPQTLSVASSGTNLVFTAAVSTNIGGNWLSVTPNTSTTPQNVSVSVNGAALAPGTYTGTITINATGASNSPQTVQVTFTVVQAQTLSVIPNSLTFNYQIGSAQPAVQTLAVSSTGGTLSFTATAATSGGGVWLTASPSSGMTPGTVSVSIIPAGLAAGTYSGTITIAAAGATNSPQTVSVVLAVAPAPLPQPVVAAVTNAASYVGGALCAGEIVYLEGTNIGPPMLVTLHLTGGRVDTLLAETRILFDGVPAPLIYVSSTKSSAVVPYGVAGRLSTTLQVEYQGARSAAIGFRVADSAPGIFTLDASGRGPGAILNQNYSVNSIGNAAGRGTWVMVYATGGGSVSPPVLDGSVTPNAEPLPRPLLPVSVTIGGRSAQVAYAGAAPGFVAGVLQLNVKIPEDLLVSGPTAVPIIVTVGGVTSQPGVAVAVQ